MVCLITSVSFFYLSNPLWGLFFRSTRVVGIRLLFSRWRKNGSTNKSKFLKIKKHILMVYGITHYYKRLKFYDKIIFWSGCILFCYPQSHICLCWRKLIVPVYYFDYLNCLSSIRPEGVGTLVLVSVVPSTPPHFLFFYLIPTLCWPGKGLGVNEKSLCVGEPLPNFFFSVLT